jgi:1-pyrroline-5-carboxylate dehydrogenase
MGVFTGLKLYEVYMAAGVPKGVFHFLSGPGSVVGDEIVNHPDVAGITFTGSYEVGMGIYKGFAKDFPKPAICEMGGKNPTIVTDKADLDKATDGVLRSAFGFGGQKCSANSRVYVHRSVYDEFVRALKEKTENVKIGDPLDRDVYLGPVIDDAAVATFEEASNEAKKNGTVVTGGERLTEGELAKGTYVQPTVAEVPLDSWIWKKELFVPFVAVAPYDDLGEAIRLANDTEYGLTAGFYSEDRAEIDAWLSSIEAGVVYVNRRAGATTGAWPGVQPFGGWKGSGTSGKAGGGPYYVQQYLREQSRTVIEE